MVLGDGNDQERKTSRRWDSREVVAIGFLFHHFLSWTVWAFQKVRRVQFYSAAGAGEVCGGDLLRESFAVSQKSGPASEGGPTRYLRARAAFV